MVGIVSEALCHLFPQFVEALLIFLAVEEAAFAFSVVIEGEACGLVEIENDVHTILSAELYSVSETGEAAFDPAAVLIFDDIVVEGNANVVCAPFGDNSEVVFSNEVVETVFTVITLREPAAEIDTLVKAFIL